MTNKQKLQKLLRQCVKTGKLPNDGLCQSITTLGISLDNLSLFEPIGDDFKKLAKNKKPVGFWGAEEFDDNNDYWDDFTPRRELILCFLIAMED